MCKGSRGLWSLEALPFFTLPQGLHTCCPSAPNALPLLSSYSYFRSHSLRTALLNSPDYVRLPDGEAQPYVSQSIPVTILCFFLMGSLDRCPSPPPNYKLHMKRSIHSSLCNASTHLLSDLSTTFSRTK